MLGRASHCSLKAGVMAKFSREDCCSSFVATNLLPVVRCASDVRSLTAWRSRGGRWRVAEATSHLVVDHHDCTGPVRLDLCAVGAVACVAAVRHATLRCAVTQPDARSHAPDHPSIASDALAHGTARSTALRSALAYARTLNTYLSHDYGRDFQTRFASRSLSVRYATPGTFRDL